MAPTNLSTNAIAGPSRRPAEPTWTPPRMEFGSPLPPLVMRSRWEVAMDWDSPAVRQSVVAGLAVGLLYPAVVAVRAWRDANTFVALGVGAKVMLGVMPLVVGPLLGLGVYVAYHLWSPWGGDSF